MVLFNARCGANGASDVFVVQTDVAPPVDGVVKDGDDGDNLLKGTHRRFQLPCGTAPSPPGVIGPVLLPPCKRQRPLGCRNGPDRSEPSLFCVASQGEVRSSRAMICHATCLDQPAVAVPP
jgi:hypothetical protein